MHVHGNAKLVPSSRRLLVARVIEERWKVADVAATFGISERTAYPGWRGSGAATESWSIGRRHPNACRGARPGLWKP